MKHTNFSIFNPEMVRHINQQKYNNIFFKRSLPPFLILCILSLQKQRKRVCHYAKGICTRGSHRFENNNQIGIIFIDLFDVERRHRVAISERRYDFEMSSFGLVTGRVRQEDGISPRSNWVDGLIHH